MRDLRKHMAWYLMGFPVGSELRRGFALVSSLDELDDLIAQLDHDAPFPEAAEFESFIQETCAAGDDFREGVTAFLEKRKANFGGGGG